MEKKWSEVSGGLPLSDNDLFFLHKTSEFPHKGNGIRIWKKTGIFYTNHAANLMKMVL